ncbi:MAG: hypothetical protein H6963_01040 [Chromatiaceae bacterium]|nr:hypothetical protein [Chromatiaceae bacterium]
MPSEKEQAAVLAQQNFGNNYRFAITSVFEGPKIDEEYPKHYSSNILSPWDYLSKLSMEQASRGSEWVALRLEVSETAFPLFSGAVVEGQREGIFYRVFIYRDYTTPKPVVIEKKLARALKESLGVDTDFISRSDVSQRVSKGRSAMHGAKEIAAKKGYDAVALVYIKPRVTFGKTYSHDIGAVSPRHPYSVSFEGHLVVRSLEKDQLFYNKKTTHHCDGTFFSDKKTTIRDDYDRIAKCEQQFQAAIIQIFLSSVQKVRSSQ